MEITYLGHSSFKIKGKNAVIVTDPFDSSFVGIKFPTTQADIVCISHHHKDHDYLAGVSDYKKVIDAPGEYEIMGVSFLGFASFHDDKKGELRGKNTIFVIEIDDFRIAHLGDLGHELPDQLIEEMGNIDILFIPTGGTYTINSEMSAKIAQNIDAPIVVPMHYKSEGLSQETFGMLEDVSEFIKLYAMPSETVEKMSIKKSDITEERKIVIFKRK